MHPTVGSGRGRIRLTLAGTVRLLDAVRSRVENLSSETLAIVVELNRQPVEGAQVTSTVVDGEPLRLGLTPV